VTLIFEHNDSCNLQFLNKTVFLNCLKPLVSIDWLWSNGGSLWLANVYFTVVFPENDKLVNFRPSIGHPRPLIHKTPQGKTEGKTLALNYNKTREHYQF